MHKPVIYNKLLGARQRRRGFTLIEILLVIAAISILASIVIVAINPAKQLGEARDAQRRADINTILNAIWQYTIDNDGTLPTNLDQTGTCAPATAAMEVCKAAAEGTCSTGQDLTVLTDTETYLVAFPTDPTASDANGTGYFASKSANGRVSVCVTGEQPAATITVTR